MVIIVWLGLFLSSLRRSFEVSDDCFQNMECLAGSYEVELFESRVGFRCWIIGPPLPVGNHALDVVSHLDSRTCIVQRICGVVRSDVQISVGPDERVYLTDGNNSQLFCYQNITSVLVKHNQRWCCVRCWWVRFSYGGRTLTSFLWRCDPSEVIKQNNLMNISRISCTSTS